MNDAATVRLAQTEARFAHQSAHLVYWQRAMLLEQLAKAPPAEQFHDEKRRVSRDAGLEHPHYVRVLDLCGAARLPQQAFARRSAQAVLLDELDGDRAAIGQRRGTEDHAHTPASDHLVEPKPLRDHRP